MTDTKALCERITIVRAAYTLAAERDHDMQIGNSDVSMQAMLFGEITVAIERFDAEAARLREALRKHAIVSDGWGNMNCKHCWGGEWRDGADPERHAPDCLAAPKPSGEAK